MPTGSADATCGSSVASDATMAPVVVREQAHAGRNGVGFDTRRRAREARIGLAARAATLSRRDRARRPRTLAST